MEIKALPASDATNQAGDIAAEVGLARIGRENGKIGFQPLGVWIAALILWPSLNLLLPYLLIQRDLGVFSRFSAILAQATILLAGTQLVRLFLAGRERYTAICTWIFVYMFFGLAAIGQIRSQDFLRHQLYVGGNYSERDLVLAQAIILVGCISFLAGGFLVNLRQTRKVPIRLQTNKISMQSLKIMCLIALTFATAIGIRAGSTLIGSRQSIQTLPDALNTGFRAFIFAVSFVIIWRFRKSGVRDWRTFHLGWRVLFALCVLSCVLINNPTSSSRYMFGATVCGLGVAWLPHSSKRVVRGVIVSYLLAMILIFPVLNLYFRYETPQSSESTARQSSILYPLQRGDGDFSMYPQVADGVEYVRANGHSFGRFYLSSVFVFVPRSVWKSKSYDVGDTIHDKLGYPTRLNLSSPIWMETYVEGGWMLLVFGLFGLGAICTLIDLYIVGFPQSRTAMTGTILAFYLPFLLRGSSLSAMPAFYVLLLTTLLPTLGTKPIREVHHVREPA